MEDKVIASQGISDPQSQPGISRRNFFRLAGGGLFDFFQYLGSGETDGLQS